MLIGHNALGFSAKRVEPTFSRVRLRSYGPSMPQSPAVDCSGAARGVTIVAMAWLRRFPQSLSVDRAAGALRGRARGTRKVGSLRLRSALIATTLLALPGVAVAQSLTAEERAFFDQHIAQLVKVEPTRLTDPSLPIVFSVPFYSVTVSVVQGDGTSNESIIVAPVASRLVSVAYPSTDDDSPPIQKYLNPSFRLRTDQDAIVLQRALDLAYPIVMDSERKTATFRHADGRWMFVRNHFMDKPSGFIFATDPSGAIRSVKYLLKLP
jgi:hypothetical protein